VSEPKPCTCGWPNTDCREGAEDVRTCEEFRESQAAPPDVQQAREAHEPEEGFDNQRERAEWWKLTCIYWHEQADKRTEWYEVLKRDKGLLVAERDALLRERDEWKAEANRRGWPKEAAKEYHRLKADEPKLLRERDTLRETLRQRFVGPTGGCLLCDDYWEAT
jgi:hypothetical protein